MGAASKTGESLDAWIERQLGYAVEGMLMSVSTPAIKERSFFGQRIVARRGSIVASPVPAAYDPDPDYFFHWYRDSAAIIEALRQAFVHGAIGDDAIGHLADFVGFTLSLERLDGREFVRDPSWREAVAPDHRQFIRPDEDLEPVHGERVRGETRVNPDGTLDISRWPRPQNDGSAAIALTLMRWLGSGATLAADLRRDIGRLIRAELAFTLRHWPDTCFDIWEEEDAHHYYTLRIQAAALEAGAAWLGAGDHAASCRDAAAEIVARLDGFWLPQDGYYRSRIDLAGLRSSRDLDIAVILAANHAEGIGPRHSPLDPVMQATLARLAAIFVEDYPINRDRSEAPALGRYRGDAYFGGNPWYVATLAAAEFEYRRAAHEPAAAIAAGQRGDAYLATARDFMPASGAMSEQFDKESGAPLSAKHLAWSYAAFITAICARTRSR